MAKRNPLYVIVDSNNDAINIANTLQEARTKRSGREDELFVKLFYDHKGDKSQIGY